MVDARDLKSLALRGVPVQVRPWAPKKNKDLQPYRRKSFSFVIFKRLDRFKRPESHEILNVQKQQMREERKRLFYQLRTAPVSTCTNPSFG